MPNPTSDYCVVSFAPPQLDYQDELVSSAKEGDVSAAVVFLPEMTTDYGKHARPRCFCAEMYGREQPWGCRWFELWCEHIEKAVSLEQQLQVFFHEGHCGGGKVEGGWKDCRADAIKREGFGPKRERFLRELMEKQPNERARLEKLSNEPYTSISLPGTERTERQDEEDALFMASLLAADRAFLSEHKGLGNSQKAEVAVSA